MFKPGFIGDVRASLEKFAAGTGRCAAVVGFADGPSDGGVDGVWNAAASVRAARFTAPTTSVTSITTCSTRALSSGMGCSSSSRSLVCRSASRSAGLVIPDGPVNQLARGGARIVVNVNGSPFRVGKHIREDVMAQRVEETGIPVVC